LFKKKNFQTKYLVHQKYLLRQFNKEKNKGDFVIIHLNPDYFHTIQGLRNKANKPKYGLLKEAIEDDKIPFMKDVPGKGLT
jgi:hypothetical protein